MPWGGSPESHVSLHVAVGLLDSPENSTILKNLKFYRNEDLNERKKSHTWTEVQFDRKTPQIAIDPAGTLELGVS